MTDGDPHSVNDVHSSGSLLPEPRRGRVSGPSKLILVGLVLALSLSFIWLGARPKKSSEQSTPDKMIDANTKPFRPAPIDISPKPMSSPPAIATALPERHDRERRGPRPEESPIFAYSGGGQGSVKPPSRPNTDGEGPINNNSDGSSHPNAPSENELSVRMKPTVLEPSRAVLLPHPDFIIPQGTIIPCTLQTAIDTNLAGYAKCILPQDVRGATGNVVLLDRGTTVVGEIQHGLHQGDARVFVLWSRAQTPSHAVISLTSPGTDELGRSGLTGTIDNHFWKRFGGTILLSVVQGAVQAVGSYAGSEGGGTSFNSVQNNGEQAADTALKSTINIPPTLSKNQGDTASIFVSRDLDFSDIYKLQLVGQVGHIRR
ncbi:type IV secretion system protein VirB10 (plasmid) [Agrobacterium leguminum]|uniref:Protein virB10 n=1 Tax=Agrobacterium deltaense NCPPB 1641 TaxID=1183425 RepID=A0A1S7U9U5_9HYPH|nr:MULTISPECIES: type IV secretion system protein VirB10 [Agrobacterium]WFS69650.1 type IV secretion system protein VirB10 [Agrobacterium leguminum]CVI63686.1 Protein virB10 [Agrobacterium deltaense NCPPB 1641]